MKLLDAVINVDCRIGSSNMYPFTYQNAFFRYFFNQSFVPMRNRFQLFSQSRATTSSIFSIVSEMPTDLIRQ